MYSISKQCYDVLFSSARQFTARATVTLADGTVLSLTAADFKQGGIKLNEATSSSGSFDLGAAIMSKLTLTLNNATGKFNDTNFIGGQVNAVQIGVYLDETTVEWIPLGVFDIDSVKYSGSAAEITAYDLLGRADRDLSDTIVYPIRLGSLLRRICADCEIPWNSDSFLHEDYIVNTPPRNASCRDVISYIAQLAGCYARMTREGSLELSWYGYNMPPWGMEDWLDGGILIDMASGDFADGKDFSDYSDDDVEGGDYSDRCFCNVRNPKSLSGDKALTVTGVRYIEGDSQQTSLDQNDNEIVTSVKGSAYLCGTDDYVFDLSDNPLLQHDIPSVLSALGGKLIGESFSSLTITCMSNPAFEAGDIIHVTDRKGNVYTAYINVCAYQFGAPQNLACDAESAAENKSVHYSAVSKLEKKMTDNMNAKINDYNQRVQALNNLMLNAMGVYKTAVQNDDGSITHYTHDKPTLEESSYISCETSNGFAYTNDGWNSGAPYWKYGMTKDGNMICNVLSAVGVVADWIKTGRIESNDGSCYFDLDNNKLVANVLSTVGIVSQWIQSERVESSNGTYGFNLDSGQLTSQNIAADLVKTKRIQSTDASCYCDLANHQLLMSNITSMTAGDMLLFYDDEHKVRFASVPLNTLLVEDGVGYGDNDAKWTVISSGGGGSGYRIIVSDNGITLSGPNNTILQQWT